MAAQKKNSADQYCEQNVEGTGFRDAPEVLRATDLSRHPDGMELHNYFSEQWAHPLTAEEHTAISLHVRDCSECAALGETIQEQDALVANLLTKAKTAEDEADTTRSINIFRSRLRKVQKKNEQVPEAPKSSKPIVFRLSVSSNQPLTPSEMADVIPRLAKAVTKRDIPRALAIVDQTINQLQTLPLLQAGALHLLAYCAWAIDYYGPHFDQVREAVFRFKQIPRKELTLSDFSLLNIAEGLVRFHQEQYGDAEILFREAQVDADRCEDPELMTISRYYRGRALGKRRYYDESLTLIREAISRDLAAKNHARVAAMELVEGWLLFLKGEIKPAQRVLERAQARLGSRSDAWIDLGNILSFQGRLHREAGPDYYVKALDCFSEAIDLYAKIDRGHRNVARARINAAFVYRLLARDLGDQRASHQKRELLQREIVELRDKAFAEINQALTIYRFAKHRHLGALSRLHSVVALLHFDNANFDKAIAAAEEAYVHACERGDHIGMANARIIQSKLALDGLGGYVDARQALTLAKEAVNHATQTENRRVQARAYLYKGHALLSLPEKQPVGAQECLDKARRCLVPEDRDYLRNSLARLENTIDKLIKAEQRRGSIVACISVEQLKQDVEAGHSLAEINEAHEEQIARFVCAELCGGNITKASQLLKTGARKIRRAVSFYAITTAVLKQLEEERVDKEVLTKLSVLKGRNIQGHARFVKLIRKILAQDWTEALETAILFAVYSGE